MNTGRVLNITKNEKGRMYALAEKRERYVSYLKSHEHDSKMSLGEQKNILDWMERKMMIL